MTIFLVLLTFAVSYLLLASPVSAHAFGQSYTLNLPIWLYLYGGGLAVVGSFLVVSLFFNKQIESLTYPKIDLSSNKFFGLLRSATIVFILKIFSLLVFATLIIASFLGSASPIENFTSIYVWVIFFLGFSYLTALFGNSWQLLNPWKIMIEMIEFLANQKMEPLVIFPKKFLFIPALLFYLIFIWLEILSNGLGASPRFLGPLLVTYSVINLFAAYVFGKELWFEKGELFGVFFNLLSKISIFEFKERKVYLRPPFAGLLTDKASNPTLVVFIVFMLSSTAFDGFRSTTAWLQIAGGSTQFTQTILLILTLLLFCTLYILSIGLMKLITKSELSVQDLALRFAFSLVPIALVYNIAHYYALLLVQGQSIIALVSDPFNLGWNLFGTASYKINISILDTKFIWDYQVYLIVLGHIAAVILAHLISLNTFPHSKKAMLSQIPMLLLMVGYTVLGLWILSQPLRVGG